MSIAAWVVGGLFSIALFVVVVLRVAKPHSRRHVYEQERIDKKARVTDSPIETSKEEEEKNIDWLGSKLALNLLFIITGMILVRWGSNTSMRAEDMGSWSWNHWFPLLMSWGFVSGLIALNAKALGEVAETLQRVLAGIAFMLFVAIPIGGWIASPSAPRQQVQQQNNTVARTPELSWTKLVLPAAGKSVYIPFPIGTHPVIDGEDINVHYKYRDGHECISIRKNECADGDIPFLFFSNGKTEINTFSYSFVSG